MIKTPERPTVALDSLGCKLNQAEIQQLARQLEAAGYRLVDPSEKADIYILNTCTVTHVADSKSRHMLRLARRRNPKARLVAIGCYAHRAPRELAQIEGVELVLGNDQKMDLLNLLGEAGSPLKVAGLAESRQAGGRTRAFIKVQDGCRNFCAYCIVPYVRSKVASAKLQDVVDEVEAKVKDGYKEVVLTGTEIGDYKYDSCGLHDLVRRVLVDTSIKRVRLSSLQPHHFKYGFLRLWGNSRLCPHFHLSLQSGSDAVLKRMNRRYAAADYRLKVFLIRDAVPEAAITTDVIVGFPGETDAEFQETLDFCRQMQFARIHVFPFSPRPGTAAATMPGQVSAAVKKERSRQMLSLAKESARHFQQRFVGETMEVLWEKRSGVVWSGLTDNYIKVYTRNSDDLTNRLLPTKLVKLYKDGVWGEI